MKDYKNSEECFQRALDMYKTIYGPTNKDVAKCLNNLGLVYEDSDQDAKAVEYLKNAINMYNQVYGTKTPNLAVAQCYYNSGK